MRRASFAELRTFARFIATNKFTGTPIISVALKGVRHFTEEAASKSRAICGLESEWEDDEIVETTCMQCGELLTTRKISETVREMPVREIDTLIDAFSEESLNGR